MSVAPPCVNCGGDFITDHTHVFHGEDVCDSGAGVYKAMTDKTKPKGPSATSLMKGRRVLQSLRSHSEVVERRERFPRPGDDADRDDESDTLQIAVEIEYAAAHIDPIVTEQMDRYITGLVLYMENVITGRPMPPLPDEVSDGLRKYPERAVAIIELLLDADKLDGKKAALAESKGKLDS